MEYGCLYPSPSVVTHGNNWRILSGGTEVAPAFVCRRSRRRRRQREQDTAADVPAAADRLRRATEHDGFGAARALSRPRWRAGAKLRVQRQAVGLAVAGRQRTRGLAAQQPGL